MPSYSIKSRIWLVSTIVMVLMGGFVYWSASLYGERAARISYDRQLHSAAMQMAEGIKLVDGELEIDLPLAAFEILALSNQDRAFYSVRAASGDLLTGYSDLPTPANPPPMLNATPVSNINHVFYNGDYSGEPVRFIALQKRLLDSEYDSFVVLILGQTNIARSQQAYETRQFVVQFVAIFLVASLLLTMFGVWFALRPLKNIRAAIVDRSAVELSPLDVSVPNEIAPLITAINGHMLQLSNTLERLKHFSSEAAHQLRTPLAGLRSEAQSALDESDPTAREAQLKNVMACSDTLADMLTHMLRRAELAHRYQSDELTRVNLGHTVVSCCHDLIPSALDHQIGLAFDAPEEGVHVRGNAFALRFMVANLIENAVKYSPAGGEVIVELTQEQAQVRLRIIDQGIGIPDAEKHQVFEYLYRSPNVNVPGTGMGLSIAKEVVDFHNGSVTLCDNQPQGLIVEVNLPIGGPHAN